MTAPLFPDKPLIIAFECERRIAPSDLRWWWVLEALASDAHSSTSSS